MAFHYQLSVFPGFNCFEWKAGLLSHPKPNTKHQFCNQLSWLCVASCNTTRLREGLGKLDSELNSQREKSAFPSRSGTRWNHYTEQNSSSLLPKGCSLPGHQGKLSCPNKYFSRVFWTLRGSLLHTHQHLTGYWEPWKANQELIWEEKRPGLCQGLNSAFFAISSSSPGHSVKFKCQLPHALNKSGMQTLGACQGISQI